jgi:phage terminase large subunit-like protein
VSIAVAEQVAVLAVQRVKKRALAPDDVKAWHRLARPEQTPPEGDWATWYIRGGRGGGKTWTGSHTLAETALTHPGDYAIVAPTYGDARDTCVEGPSGLLAALGTNRVEVDRGQARHVRQWNRSLGELKLANGGTVYIDGADDGALRIQGKNLRGLWADEVGLWRNWKTAWEESIQFAVRLAPARIVATGTPKRGHRLVKQLMADETVHKTLVRTLDNAANLDAATLDKLRTRYEGTTLGRQELGGEVLEDVPGALWSREIIRYRPAPVHMHDGSLVPDMGRIVVAIDPAVTSGEESDETGMMVVGLGVDGYGYTLADLTCRMAPAGWARRAVEALRDFKADRIVAEANNGGDLVSTVIRTVDPNVPVTLVHAARGKRTRAEPVAALYEQGRWFHVEPFPELEDQQCSYLGEPGEESPDRMDALVWGASELFNIGGDSWGGGKAWS